MSSETQNIITSIRPRLVAMGWNEHGLEHEVTCNEGKADIVYSHNGKRIAVVEAKRVGGDRDAAMCQAKRYAESMNIPLAIATDGETFLSAYHVKKGRPLCNHNGDEVSITDFSDFTVNNLLHFIGNPSLHSRVKSESELRYLFTTLNNRGREAGLTSGVERLQEIAKLVFIKMLVDNNQYLDHSAWEAVMEERRTRKINLLNHHITTVRSEGIEMEDIQIDVSKSGVVADILEILHGVDFNHKYYDANSTLFQSFLAERARGGGTNDLGQYFTPQKVIRLMVSLSNYSTGKTVYDPFCGTAGVLCEFFMRRGIEDVQDKKSFGRNFLFGSELSRPVAALAKMNMVLVGDGHSNIVAVDSMIASNDYMQKDTRFDYVVTNIPFDPQVPSDDVPPRYFAHSHDGSDVANFIEHCINRCKPGGRIILIVGKGFLTENQSANFRTRLLTQYDVQAIYDLYSGIFAPYTPVHSCMFIINKSPPQSAKTIDFFVIKNDDDISIADTLHDSPDRYNNGYYKVSQELILSSKKCDLRGRVYETKHLDRDTHCRISDLAEYIPSSKTERRGEIPEGLKKMTTPNSIQDGIRLMESQSNKQTDSGYGSFVCELQKGAVVVSRITNKRVSQESRYFGSGLVGDDAGHLITKEYYQLKPHDPVHAYYLLYHLRTKQCQDIAEWASGTSGQQRIDVKFLLNQPIPLPTPQRIKDAKATLELMEKHLRKMRAMAQEIEDLAAQF